MIVRHNISADNNRRQLGIVEKNLNHTTEKLSSGYRINRAADDAAGLSISEKMRGQVRGLKRASLNTSDGISLIQTAEAGMNEIHEILQRMEELSVQSANDTSTDDDRETIQEEISALTTEIDRIAEETEFNTLRLLNGQLAPRNQFLQSGGSILHTSAGTVHIIYSDTLLQELLYAEDTSEAVNPEKPTTSANVPKSAKTDEAAAVTPDSVNGIDVSSLKTELKNQLLPQAVGAILDTCPKTFDYLGGSNIGIGLTFTDDADSGVLASVSVAMEGTKSGEEVDVDLAYTLMVNIHSLVKDGAIDLTDSIRDDLEVTIVHEMTHALMDEAMTVGMIGVDKDFNNVNPFPAWFKEGTAQASAGAFYNGNDWVNGNGTGLNLHPNTDFTVLETDVKNSLVANPLNSGTQTANYGVGYLAVMYLGYLADGSGTVSRDAISTGLDTFLKSIRGNLLDTTPGTEEGMNLDEAIAAYTKYASREEFEKGFSKDPEAIEFVANLVNTVQEGAGGLVRSVNGTFFSDYRREDDLSGTDHFLRDSGIVANNKNVFNLNTDYTKVWNDYSKSADGSVTSPSPYLVLTGGAGGEVSGGGTSLVIQVGANAEQFVHIYIAEMTARAIGVDQADVSTRKAAEETISAVLGAIEEVSFHRVSLGAYQNRLEHAVSNADTGAENLETSESKLRDANLAKEMVRYSANEILLQAGQAMLSQTNRMPQGIVALLR